MKNKTAIEAKSMIFSHLFHTGRFRVPWHQRRYDWKKEHVIELLRDIDEAIRENRRCYFLGAIMLVQKERRFWEINDGQQRMVTVSLICACLSRLFHAENEQIHENLALRVLFDLDVNSTARLSDADELDPRLTPPRNDKTRYNLMIRGKTIGTNGKLTAAWQLIEQFVSGMGLEKSKRFMDFLLNKIEVACLYIPDDVDPNSVYETINHRGKHLDDLDLIRNYLYSYFNAAEERSRRDTVHDNLENVRTQLRNDARAADYVRCFFQCKFGFLPKDSFYRSAREKIRSVTEQLPVVHNKPADYIYHFVDEFALKERVELFGVIANQGAADSFVEGFQVNSATNGNKRNLFAFLRELQAYKVVQPMVFALLNWYVAETDARKKKSLAKRVHKNLKCLTSFVMRTAFVAPKFEPSHYESELSHLARKIMSTGVPDSVEVMSFLRECDSTYGIINDEKFIDKMKFVEMRSDKKAKRFLLSVNRFVQSDGNVISEKWCSVEHILPKSDMHWSGWKSFSGQNTSDWIHRIGNLTLLGQEDNRPGQKDNYNFLKKKNNFEQSAVAITRALHDQEDWSPKTINARQEKLARLAVKVWAF